jgi:hypothetical protein
MLIFIHGARFGFYMCDLTFDTIIEFTNSTSSEFTSESQSSLSCQITTTSPNRLDPLNRKESLAQFSPSRCAAKQLFKNAGAKAGNYLNGAPEFGVDSLKRGERKSFRGRAGGKSFRALPIT